MHPKAKSKYEVKLLINSGASERCLLIICYILLQKSINQFHFSVHKIVKIRGRLGANRHHTWPEPLAITHSTSKLHLFCTSVIWPLPSPAWYLYPPPSRSIMCTWLCDKNQIKLTRLNLFLNALDGAVIDYCQFKKKDNFKTKNILLNSHNSNKIKLLSLYIVFAMHHFHAYSVKLLKIVFLQLKSLKSLDW